MIEEMEKDEDIENYNESFAFLNRINMNISINRINKQYLAVFLVLMLSLIVRIYLSHFDGFKGDINDFKSWSLAVYNGGFANFYPNNWSDYPPFYFYLLWVVGAFFKFFFSFNGYDNIFTILIKLPANIADIASAYLIFLVIKKYANFRIAYLSMIFYAFNPAIIIDSAIWGQVDAIYTFFIILSLVLIVYDKLELSGASMAIAVLTKPQSLVILPFIVFLIILKRNYLRMAKSIIVFLSVFFVLAIPFFEKISIFQLSKIYTFGYEYYAVNSANAFNFWAFLGLWKTDDTTFLFLSYRYWGYILFGILFIYIIVTVYGNKDYKSFREEKFIYYGSAILFFGFFMIFTRVHERYMFPVLALLLIAASIDRRLNYIYAAVSLTFFLNLAYVLPLLNKNPAQFVIGGNCEICSGNPVVLLISGINSIIFIYALYWYSNINFISLSKDIIKFFDTKVKLISKNVSIKTIILALSVILVVLIPIAIYMNVRDNPAVATNENRIATISTDKGIIKFELYEKEVPITTKNFIELAQKGFYDGLTFHSVIPGLLIQGGDPKRDGTGGSGKTIPLEINPTLTNIKGAVGMGRFVNNPNSASSQFYILLEDAKFLDNKYAVFGQVIEGQDVVEKIKKGDKILKVTISTT